LARPEFHVTASAAARHLTTVSIEPVPNNMTTVPLLDLKPQYTALKTEIDAAIARVVDSQHFILGPEVSALEEEVAGYSGARHGIGMSSGTDALLAALMAHDVAAGDEVIVPTYTFFATAGVVSRLGAKPVFVDIDPVTYNLLPDATSAAITERTRAIIPVHLYGRMVEMEPFIDMARRKGIAVIEDAAQAIGATDAQGRRAGSIGDMGCFSFFPSKNLGGFGDGGMTVTQDDGVAQKLKMLRMHGSEPKYYHAIVGGNFRLDALQAAVLRVKLRHLDRWTEGRRRNADTYRALFAETGLATDGASGATTADAAVILPAGAPGHIYNQFVIRVRNRDGLQAHLKEHGVGTEIYYPVPLHRQQCFADLGYAEGRLPHAEAAARETLALPIYPELTELQIEQVVDTVRGFYSASHGAGQYAGPQG
jgi:dTDP-4-amino-4,6-dideoxygalactose transaminase